MHHDVTPSSCVSISRPKTAAQLASPKVIQIQD